MKYGDGNTTCILIRNSNKTSFDKCYTDQGFESKIVKPRFDYF